MFNIKKESEIVKYSKKQLNKYDLTILTITSKIEISTLILLLEKYWIII